MGAPESAVRAAAALRAWRRRPNVGDPYVRSTPTGEVRIEALSASEVDGVVVLEVTVGDPESEDPSYRVINPPTMVEDGQGGWREDPLAAVADVIGQHGGHARRRRGRK